LDQIESQNSEFPTIRALTESLNDLSTLRGLQKQLFIGIPEKRLNFRIHWRFGIKTFSHIKKTLEMGLHVHDLIKIVDGPYRGKKAQIETIDSENGQLSVILVGKASKRPITISMSSVFLIEPRDQ
jgi:transcription antitermination factor NusG